MTDFSEPAEEEFYQRFELGCTPVEITPHVIPQTTYRFPHLHQVVVVIVQNRLNTPRKSQDLQL